MKDELKRIKAGLLAGVMCLSLSGCTSSNGFDFVEGENRSVAVEKNSYVNSNFIRKCYVAEVYNILKEEKELYIVTQHSFDEYKGYNDIFTPYSIMFRDDNDRNEFFEFRKLIPLADYINALGLVQYSYSYEDLANILETIKSVHEYEDNLELTK